MNDDRVTDRVAPLLRSLERYDFLSAAHTWRVALYARAVAEAAGLGSDDVDRVTLGAALHDVGKLDVPQRILQKPGALTDEEFDEVRRHPVHGVRRLEALGVDDPVIRDLVRHHHERIDGAGYPDRLAGDDVPPGARYFAVIDTFDALTSVRPYRRDVGAGAAERAIATLRGDIGSHYCAEAVELFERVYRSGVVGWVLEYYNDRAQIGDFDPRAAASAGPG